MSDIVDQIDELVDASLESGPVDDYNADRYDRCPHCHRHWHGLAITERIAEMYKYGRYDDTYSADDDDSPVLCRGSNFIGPMPAERHGYQYQEYFTRTSMPGVDEAVNATLQYAGDQAAAIMGMTQWPDWMMPPASRPISSYEEGQRVSFNVNGHVWTGVVSRVDRSDYETVLTVQQHPDSPRYYGMGFSSDYAELERGPDISEYVIDEAHECGGTTA